MILMELESLLKQYFGYTSFRPGQHEVIQTLLEGRDCLAIMPTGAGKSICFQLPALMMPGVTLVISPLISLMKDQVDSLVNQEIPATYINSQCTFEEAKARFAAIRAGRVKLVYISPERLENEFFTSFMQSLPISMFIIDEAHCVSQWGHDFRPSYCAIKDWIAALPRRPVVGAFTATATEKVKEDMMTLLGLEKERIFIGGFDRPNLYFRVVRTNRKLDFALAYVQQHQEDSGIIYAATRKEVDRVYEELTRRGIRAGRYHAGLSDDVRRTMQDAFTYDRLQVIVATNAFGMGIDKSNVRYVIHYQMPKNIESYYQEAGRAGRDGAPGECILLFSRQDIMIQKFLIEQSVHDPQQQAVEFRLLNAMVRYCEGNHCLRHYILTYFGEHPSWQRCEKCGNCDQETVEEDMTEQVRSICLCVDELKGRFGMTMVCDILKGSQNAKVRRYGFHGTSHRYVAGEVAKVMGVPVEKLRIINCHLGNGSSLAAIKYGKCVDTTMGFTPLAGVLMGTRCGDIDPAIVLNVMDNHNLSTKEMDTLMNKKSGVLGISGVSSDFRDLGQAAAEGNERAQLALDMFHYQVRKEIGAFAAAMGGVDVITFTAGVGENGIEDRAAIAEGLEYLGAKLDPQRNDVRGKDALISTDDSTVKMYVIPTNEEIMIARDTKEIVSKQ